MAFVKCFDAVSMVCEEATRQFAPLFKLNKEDYSILEEYCKAIDMIAKESGGISYDVEVHDIKMTISVTLECECMIVSEKNHPFLALAERAISFEFSISENGRLNISYVFPPVWDKI